MSVCMQRDLSYRGRNRSTNICCLCSLLLLSFSILRKTYHLFPLQEGDEWKTTFDLGHFLGCSIFQTLHILISCRDTSDHQSRVCQVLPTLLVSQVCVSAPKSKLSGENKLIFKKTLSCTGHMHEGQREERSTGCRWSSSWVLPGIQE